MIYIQKKKERKKLNLLNFQLKIKIRRNVPSQITEHLKIFKLNEVYTLSSYIAMWRNDFGYHNIVSIGDHFAGLCLITLILLRMRQ